MGHLTSSLAGGLLAALSLAGVSASAAQPSAELAAQARRGQDAMSAGRFEEAARIYGELVEAVPEVPWIRIMYAYPQHVSARLIETMAARSQVVPYLDLPLQHAHPDTLRRMRRCLAHEFAAGAIILVCQGQGVIHSTIVSINLYK